MKIMKRLGALFLSAALLLPMGAISSMAVSAATPATTLQMVDATTGALLSQDSFSAYRIVSWDASHGNMQLNDKYASSIAAALGLTNPSDATILNTMKNMTGAQTEAVANALRTAVNGVAADFTSTSGYFAASLNMPNGYYLVLETADNANDNTVISKPMLVRIPDDTVVKVKNSTVTIDKKIVDTSTGTKKLVDASVAALNDVVSYQSTATIPTYSSDAVNLKYEIGDKLGSGLTYQTGSLVVTLIDGSANGTVLTANTDYTPTYGVSGFDIKLSDANIKAWGNAGYKLQLNYSAKLDGANGAVNYGSTGNPNTIVLTYTNNPYTSNDYKTVHDHVITYAVKLIISKFAQDKTTKLAGAVFTLYVWNGTGYTQLSQQTADSAGGNLFTFTKLKAGKYKLEETTAPTGYNPMDPIIFNVSATFDNGIAIPTEGDFITAQDNSDTMAKYLATWSASGASFGNDGTGNLTYEVDDTQGFTLPGAGGIGTYLFTGGGILLILAAGVLLTIYLKKQKSVKPGYRA